MQTLLQIVQAFVKRTGLPQVNAVTGVNNASVRQALGLLEEVGGDLISRFRWQVLTRKATFTSLATMSQGSVYTLADSSLERIVPDSLYNQTEDDFLAGPVPLPEWQTLSGGLNPSPTSVFTVVGNELLVYPILEAGMTMSFFWQTRNWIMAGDGSSYKDTFTSDDDLVLLDPELLKLGMRYLWKLEKGLPYAEELRRFEAMALDKSARDMTKPTLSMSGSPGRFSPSILVPLNSTIPT